MYINFLYVGNSYVYKLLYVEVLYINELQTTPLKYFIINNVLILNINYKWEPLILNKPTLLS